MSVLAMTHLDKKPKLMAFVKGSPERIAELSLKQSLPKDFDRVLNDYAQRGFRVIAVAFKDIQRPYSELNQITRDEVESDLHFLGLVIMQTKLKQCTTKIIREL